MEAFIAAIEYYLPRRRLSTEDLSAMHPDWSVEKIDAKTGIRFRHIAGQQECASDMAFMAVQKLFRSGICSPSAVDYLIMCTQSPDYLLPTTACLLQDRLGLATSTGAFDINLGCSGFVYGLGLANALISSGQSESLLLVTADTYSKYINRDDRDCMSIFGDGASATLIQAMSGSDVSTGPFVYGTDGSGGLDIVALNSGTRIASERWGGPKGRSNQSFVNTPRLLMNGKRVFDFVLEVVPRSVYALLKKAELKLEDVDLFVFHQANAFILEELRRNLQIPREKFQVTLAGCGNTVSSTIPIALKHAQIEGKLKYGASVMVIGFGVGYSWGAALLRWRAQ